MTDVYFKGGRSTAGSLTRLQRMLRDQDLPIHLYEEFHHPEIVIFGLDPVIMHRLINDVGNQVRNGARYSDGEVSCELLEGYPCAFRLVNPLRYRETRGWAVWFYGSADFPVLQLFWPDKKSGFPWESGFDESLRVKQPDLSTTPAPS